MENSRQYEKREGTNDLSASYRTLMKIFCILSMCMDNNITTFKVTTGEKAADLILNITFKNESERILRICFKYKGKSTKQLSIDEIERLIKNLTNKSKSEKEENPLHILHANISFDNKNHKKTKGDLTIEIVPGKVDKTKTEQLLLNTSYWAQVKLFKKGNLFRENAFVSTNQDNVDGLTELVKKMLLNFFQCQSNVYNDFFNFMSESTLKKYILTKDDIIGKLTELVLSPWILILSSEACNEKSRNLEEAVMNFQVTIIEEGKDISKIWSKISEDNDDIAKVLSKYNLSQNTSEATPRQKSLALWYLYLVPIVVEVTVSNRTACITAVKLLQKHLNRKRSIILIGDIKEEFEGCVFKNLSDLENRPEIYQNIITNFTFSDTLKQKISLEYFIEIYEKISNLITVSHLFKLSQNVSLINLQPKEDLPEAYILRKLSRQGEVFSELNFAIANEPVNVFIGRPGIGKSTFLKSSRNKNLDLKEFWSSYVQLFDYNSFLKTKPKCGELLHRFLGLEESVDPLLNKVILIFRKENRIHLFLNGLDKLDSECVDYLLTVLKQFEGVILWMTSRGNLKEKICEYLDVEPFTIEGINRTEQKSVLENRLRKGLSSEKTDLIISAIFTSVEISFCVDLLDNPLHLDILSENFNKKPSLSENIQRRGFIPVKKIFDMILEAKWNRLFEMTKTSNVKNQVGHYYRNYWRGYEIPAIKYVLEDNDFKKLKLNFNDSEIFLKQMVSEGDKLGIIKVTKDSEVNFTCQAFAKYFACIWLKENISGVRILKENLFSKYNELRVLLDIMLITNKNPLHLAIISNDYDLFKKYITNVDQKFSKDQGGRSALHLACCYGRKSLVVDNLTTDLQEDETNKKIIEELLLYCQINEKDELFGFDCFDYSIRCNHLIPVEIFLEKGAFLNVTLLDKYGRDVLINYCKKFNYSHLLTITENTLKNVCQ